MDLVREIRAQDAKRRYQELDAHLKRETERLRARLRELLGQKVALEVRLAAADTWSERWWLLLGQLDIVCREYIKARKDFVLSPWDL